jgi:hypothetical protein
MAWARQEHARGDRRQTQQRDQRGPYDPAIKARIAELGSVSMPMTPADFAKFIAEETEKWGKVVKFSGAKAD